MSEHIPNYSMLATQILLIAQCQADFMHEYLIVPEGMYDCYIRHNDGKTCLINSDMSIMDAAEKIDNFITDTQLGE